MGVRTALLLLTNESRHIERPIKSWLERCCRLRVCVRTLPSNPMNVGPWTMWVAETFSETATWIEQTAGQLGGPAALREVAVYIEAYDPDLCGWEDIQPLSSTNGPQLALISMLVLAFPEVHWVFYTPYSPPSGIRFYSAHNLICANGLDSLCRLHRGGFAPLFDPVGIRELMRGSLRTERLGEDTLCAQLPKRHLEAVALDEESEYAFFTAYLAYRVGFRAWSIATMALMRWRLTADEAVQPIALSLEDVFLSFPDRSFEEPLSDLRERYEKFRALATVDHRVLITVGRGLGESGGGNAANNRSFLKQLGGSFSILYKPLTGFFETARKARLQKVLEWPPAKRKRLHVDAHGHSAPGRLLAVASMLLARAQVLLDSSLTVADAIHAAVLALDAKELLGGRTPTLALRAIALQQEAEIAAESLSLGVQHNLDVRQRLQDIKTEVEFVGRWVHPSQKRRAVLNARLSIAEQLAKRFHEFNQIEEEAGCLAEARRLRFDFWVLESPVRWPLWPFLRYLAFSLSSVGRFVAIVLAWNLFFGGSYYVLGLITGKPDLYLGDAMASSARLFFTGSNSSNWDTLRLLHGRMDGWEIFWRYWIMFQSIVGFTNLGLLLSHLYMIVSRR
jgi:hypothetical protein